MNSNGRDTSTSTYSGSERSNNSSTNNYSSTLADATLGDNEHPTFAVEQVQLGFELDNALIQLCVQNNIMFLILQTHVLRIDLDNPSTVGRYSVPSMSSAVGSTITNAWLHPSGNHFIIQTNGVNYYYLNESYSKFKALPKFKNLNISQIAFPHDQSTASDKSTGDFLIGTNEGHIYLAQLKPHDPETQDSKRDEKYIKLVFKYQHAEVPVLSGLTFTNNNSQINAFLNNNLYVWDCFDTSYSELTKVFKTNPKVVSFQSDLTGKSTPIFASNGHLYVYIFSKSNEILTNDEEILLSQAEKLDTSKINENISLSSNSIIVTPHHLVTFNDAHDKLISFNKLSLSNASSPPVELNLKSFCNPGEYLFGITADFKNNTYWIFSNNSIYELIIRNEAVSVWYNYYKMGKFEEALKCLEENNNNGLNSSDLYKIDLILIKQGYNYLQRGGFGLDYAGDGEEKNSENDFHNDLIELQIKGVRILANLSEPFEKVCLMLLNLQDHLKIETTSKQQLPTSSLDISTLSIVSQKLLLEYLLEKFRIARDLEKNKIRMVVLSSWIVELMLRMINKLETDVSIKTASPVLGLANGGLKHNSLFQSHKKNFATGLNNSFQEFLTTNYKYLDRGTIYQIMKISHCPDKLIYYAELIEDYEFILQYYLDISDFSNSLRIMTKIYTSSSDESKEIIYRASTVMLANDPMQTIETWLKFNEDINHERLLPAILTYNKNNESIPIYENYSLQFLLKIVYEKSIRSEQINNHYLSLLITYPENDKTSKKQATKQILKLLNFLSQEATKKRPTYNANFILRLCLTYKQFQPAVWILINDMNLYDIALSLALDNDLTDLGEYVLRAYDNSLSKKERISIESSDRSYGSDEYEKEEDINFIGKVRLEEESYNTRKKLWLMFAKYLVQLVCEGKMPNIHFDDEVDVEESKSVNSQAEVKKTVQDVTNDLVESITNEKKDKTVPDVDLKQLNKVLKYIISLSNSGHSSGVIGLKDLLPLFPESIMINNFKEEIVKSLNQYNNKINQLTLEMKESLNISSNLKLQIRDSNKISEKAKIYSIIEPGELCQICKKLLINKNFIYFPNCHHGHHKDCLIRAYIKLKGNYRFKKIFLHFKKNPSAVNKRELDDMITRECLLCNDGNILVVDNSLIDSDRDQSELIEWEL